MIQPFIAAYYSDQYRKRISDLALSDLDSMERFRGDGKDPNSFRHVIVGEPDKRAEVWQSWITNGQIDVADIAYYYVLRHRQKSVWGMVDRWAVYAQVSANDPNLFVHEDVFSEGVERARQSIEYCESDLSPIFLGFDESRANWLKSSLERVCVGQEPFLKYYESTDSIHEVWRLTDRNLERKITESFVCEPLYVLDGHHRLAAAQENVKIGIGDGKILACICSMDERSTLILPIHRSVISKKWAVFDAFMRDLKDHGCEVEPYKGFSLNNIYNFHLNEGDSPSCLMIHGHNTQPFRITFPNLNYWPAALARLAVTNLDLGFLARHPEANVLPTPSLTLVLEQLSIDQTQVAFLMPSILPQWVRDIAQKRLKMPRKSTRFLPKPGLGLICRPWGI